MSVYENLLCWKISQLPWKSPLPSGELVPREGCPTRNLFVQVSHLAFKKQGQVSECWSIKYGQNWWSPFLSKPNTCTTLYSLSLSFFFHAGQMLSPRITSGNMFWRLGQSGSFHSRFQLCIGLWAENSSLFVSCL